MTGAKEFFRVLNDAEFQALTPMERLDYMKQAIEALEKLKSQISEVLFRITE